MEKKYRVAIYYRTGNPDDAGTDTALEIQKNAPGKYGPARSHKIAAEISGTVDLQEKETDK